MVLRMKEEEEIHLPSFRQAVAKQNTKEDGEQRLEKDGIKDHQERNIRGDNENIENLVDKKEVRRDYSSICSDHKSLGISNK